MSKLHLTVLLLSLTLIAALAQADAEAEREALARLAHELTALEPLVREAEVQADRDARMVRKFSPPLCRAPIIVFEDTPQPFSTADGTGHVRVVSGVLDQPIVETLVIALKVVVLGVLVQGVAKVAFAQRYDLGETL